MAILMAIEQCTPGAETIGRKPRSRAFIDALGAGYRGSTRSLRPLKGQLKYFYVFFLRCGGWFYVMVVVVVFVPWVIRQQNSGVLTGNSQNQWLPFATPKRSQYPVNRCARWLVTHLIFLRMCDILLVGGLVKLVGVIMSCKYSIRTGDNLEQKLVIICHVKIMYQDRWHFGSVPYVGAPRRMETSHHQVCIRW